MEFVMTAHIPRFIFLQKQNRPLKYMGFISDVLTGLMVINVPRFSNAFRHMAGTWQRDS